MLKRHKQQERDRGRDAAEVMSRHESAVWLGRALSTSEVALHAILELMDLLAYQQAIMENVVATSERLSQRDGQDARFVEEPEAGSSEKVLQKLEELRMQIMPVLQTVEEACRQLEQMLAERAADH
jgi:hypothetical protein